jgi:hypothetical protein
VKWLALVVLVVGATSGCKGGDPSTGASSAAVGPAGAPLTTATSRPRGRSICDVATEADHVCVEYDDRALADEKRRSCPSGMRDDARCPEADKLGACRLPDGSVRWTYPPRTPEQHDKACREARGKWSLGDIEPAADPLVVVRCEGKYERTCEEETIHVAARTKQASEECAQFGGTFGSDGPCPRAMSPGSCDLEGLRTLVYSPGADDPKGTCEKRGGRFVANVDAAPVTSASAMPSASAPLSASAPPSASAPLEEPEPPPAEIRLRTQ